MRKGHPGGKGVEKWAWPNVGARASASASTDMKNNEPVPCCVRAVHKMHNDLVCRWCTRICALAPQLWGVWT